METRRTFATLVAVAVLALASRGARAADDENPRVITTSGEAVVFVVPDEVIVGFGVETFHQNLDEAKSSNDAASKRLLAAIKGMEVEDKHVQTDVLQVEVQYRSSRPSQGIEGYFARRSYSVTLKDTKKLEPMIDRALKNGANQLAGIEYRTSELRKHRDQARKMAIKAAREKATDLAAELACKIGSPRTIGEGSVGYYGAGRGNTFAMAQNNAQFDAGGAGDAGEAVPMGQIGIHAQVGVTFDLVP